MRKTQSGTNLGNAKKPNQSASGIAFVGFASAMRSISGLQYIVFAADMKTLQAAWADAGGSLFDPAMARPVTIFERLKMPNGADNRSDPAQVTQQNEPAVSRGNSGSLAG